VITSLEAKGDGIQSLVAIGVRRHALQESLAKSSYIFAIEEPEAHLHPDAIHELKTVLDELSNKDQIVITTHSPVFVNRVNIKSNVIVHKSVAKSAHNLSEIRKILGVRSYDNLINAELVLLVEGEADRVSIVSVISRSSSKITEALRQGRLLVEPLYGASKLSSKIAFYKSLLCKTHCFLDSDGAGRLAVSAAKEANLISECDYSYAFRSGHDDTEFEDLVHPSVYASSLMTHFGLDVNSVAPRNPKAKWSSKMKDMLAQCGKPFDESSEKLAKTLVAQAVHQAGADPIAAHAKVIFENLARELELKLLTVTAE
jgi:putative ATP-dependent endonuclease of OLD family